MTKEELLNELVNNPPTSMSLAEAYVIDRITNVLAGGEGEHEIWAYSGFAGARVQLRRYAQSCGGRVSKVPRKHSLILDCINGYWEYSFDKTGQRLMYIFAYDTKPLKPTLDSIWWDHRRVRVYDGCNQVENSDQPILSDYWKNN
jgi:hypothetical protein